MTKVTRDVISDLWPLYSAGEASADTRALVEGFLAGDPEFARTLRASFDVPPERVEVPADQEAQALQRTLEAMRGGRWPRRVALVATVLTALALVRLHEDDAETAVVRVAVACLAWVVYGVLDWRRRVRARRAIVPRGER